MLTREQILAVDDLQTETVQVPEWGGEVVVSVMWGDARDEWEASLRGTDDKMMTKGARAKLVACCVVGEDGNLLFTIEDVVKLGRKSARALDRVASVALRLNKLTDKSVEELKGN